MAINQVPETQQMIGVRFGRPEKTTINVVVKSLSNSPITVVVAGAPIVTINPVALGTDGAVRSEAGFIGNAMISGLRPNTKYTYKIYQDGYKLETDENNNPWFTWTACEENDDFIVVPVTCDNNSTITGQVKVAGGWTKVRAIAEANPDKPMYLVHVDDILGYNDFYFQDDGSGVGGYHTTGPGDAAQVNANIYDYAIGAFSAYGLYDSSLATGQNVDHIEWGQMADRIWCYRNIPALFQRGDHDSGANEMSWDLDKTDDGIISGWNSSPQKCFNSAQSVYDEFLKPLTGASLQNADTSSYHWHHRLGCLKILSADSMGGGSGDAIQGNYASRPTSVYGTNQVSDILDFGDSGLAFTMIPMANGIRQVKGTIASKNTDGAQNPIADNPSVSGGIAATADYLQLFTGNGGLMDLDSTNGVNGTMFTVIGDWHSAKVQRNQSDAAAHIHSEDFYSINLGTINGSVNFEGLSCDGVPPFDGTTVEMARGGDRFEEPQGDINQWWYVPMFVYGSRATPEIEVEYYDQNENLLWNKKFVSGQGNDAKAI